jgi:hypothetical protein
MPRFECPIEWPAFTLTTWASHLRLPAKVIQDGNTARQKSRAAASVTGKVSERQRESSPRSLSVALIAADCCVLATARAALFCYKANEVLGDCWRQECSLTSQQIVYSGSTSEIGRCCLPVSGWRRPSLPCSPDSGLCPLLSGRFVGARHGTQVNAADPSTNS